MRTGVSGVVSSVSWVVGSVVVRFSSKKDLGMLIRATRESPFRSLDLPLVPTRTPIHQTHACLIVSHRFMCLLSHSNNHSNTPTNTPTLQQHTSSSEGPLLSSAGHGHHQAIISSDPSINRQSIRDVIKCHQVIACHQKVIMG